MKSSLGKKLRTLCLVVLLGSIQHNYAQDYAISFDGSEDFANCGNIGISGASARTLEAWIFCNSFNEAAALQMGYPGQTDQEFSLRTLSTDNEWRVNIWGTVQGDVDFSAPGSKNAWNHFAATYDGTTIKVYYNGNLVASENRTINTYSTDLVLGTWQGTYWFDGMIDEVRVWNTARTETEIQNFMNTKLSGSESGLVAYYPMDDGSGTTITDESTNSYTATLFGNTDWSDDAFQPAGSGTSGDPYQIAELKNLSWIINNSASWSSYFIQTADIDATSTSSWNSGAGFNPIGPYFVGNYNGNGYVIDQLFIYRPSTTYVGLFGLNSGATISNLGLTNADITGNTAVGIMVGENNNSSLTNCYVSGNLTGNNSLIGGLVGWNHNGGTVNNSYSVANVVANASGGGLVGVNENSNVYNSYCTGNTTRTSGSPDESIGGLAGYNTNSGIYSCYSTGDVSYADATNPTDKGFLGGGTGTMSNNFFNTETSNQASCSGATAISSAQMQTLSTFTSASWDFKGETTNGSNNYWGINPSENSGFPFLEWQGYDHISDVSTQAVTSITPTTATGNGTIDNYGDPSVTQHGVCWNTTGTPTISDSKTEEGAATSTGAFTSDINGLSEYTTYYVRAYATNNAGTVYGDEVSFTTLRTLPVVSTEAASIITNISAIGNGTISDLGYPNPTQYGVCWNTTGNPSLSDNYTEEGGASATGSFTSEISGLTLNTTYYVKAYVTNNAGTVYGNEVSFTTAFFAGSGTSQDPYQIATLSDLRNLAENASLWDKHFIQTANIDASETSGWNGAAGWNPIGNYNDKFTGYYNGQGHIITGLYINRPGVNYIGFLGFADAAMIDSLGCVNVNFSGQEAIGGLVGRSTNTTISKCYTSGSISGTTWSAGGLSGYNENSTVENCYSDAAVSGNNAVGGLIGNNTTSSVSNSYSCGSVSGAGSYVGGFIGGFGEATNCFWDTQTSGQASSWAGTGKVTSEMTDQATYPDWDFKGETVNGEEDIWNIGNGRNNGYPYFDWQYPTDPGPLLLTTKSISNINSNSASSGGEMFNYEGTTLLAKGVCWSTAPSPTINDDTTNNGTAIAAYTSQITGLLGNTTYYLRAYTTDASGTSYGNELSFTTPFFIGSGTSGDPYHISSLNDLLNLSLNQSLWDKYFIQTTDIDASETSSWNEGAGWLPIGGIDPYFSGAYNGQGYTISNLYCNRPSNDYVGLFMRTNNATIENLGLEDINITGYDDCGGLVGYARNSNITLCYTTGSVSGDQQIGGLFGSTSESQISYCYSTVNVSGFMEIGGLAGYSNSSISNCYSSGTASGSARIGGLAGYNNDSISNCYSSVNVSASAEVSTIGGLVGLNQGSVNICYSNGMVDGQIYQVGGLIGYSSGDVTSSFWDIQTSGQATSSGGTGENTADLKFMATYINWDFVGESANGSDDLWNIGNEHNNGYPHLEWQHPVNPLLPSLSTTNASIINENSANSGGNITNNNGSAIIARGVCWAQSRYPTISDSHTTDGTGTGEFTSSISGLTVNTTYYLRAYATNSEGTAYGAEVVFTTPYFMGSGTSGDPYQISNLTALKNISDNNSFWDKHFIQIADIDASETSTWDGGAGFTPIGNSTTQFSGTYNGDGHTIESLSVNRPNTDNVGLFGYTNNATIASIGIEACSIVGKNNIGGLIGCDWSNSTIVQSYTSGSIGGNNSVGGMVGVASQTSLSNCFSLCQVNSLEDLSGGLVAQSYTTSITNCYATGLIEGADRTGGLVAYNHANSTIQNGSFWDTETTGQLTSADVGTGKTTAEMNAYYTFNNASWDFVEETANGTDNHWGINPVENSGYPFLAWQGYTHSNPWPIVTTLATDNIAVSSTTGHGNITALGLSNPTQHGVCWNTSENPTTDNNKTEEGAVSATGAFSSSITGLSAYTTYYIRAYAINSAGTTYGTQLSFTTLPELPVVTTQAVTMITTSTAVGNGNITDLGAPNPTQHGICWNTTGNPSLSDFFTEEGAASSTGAFTSIMTGLSPNTTYYVKAYAINDGGTNYGDEVSFTTLQNISAVMSGSWSNPAIWGGIIPGAGDNVIIPAGLLITVDGAKETANCNDLTIEPTANLTIDGTLNVNGNLLVEGDASGQGSLIDNGTLNVSGTQQVKKLLTPNRWWYITSPVDSTSSTVFDANTTSHYVYWWQEAAANHGWNQIGTTDVPMDSIMKGYAVYYTDSDKLLTFEGELNTGAKSVGLTRTEGVAKEGYNLIGNPYPSAYDLYMFHDGYNISSSIYYRTENEGVMNFATYNAMYEIAGTNGGQRYVPSMQAFWVRVPEGNTTGVVEFNNTKRIHSDQTFYKSSDVPVVRLSISQGSKSDETIIIFNDQETEGFSIYDSEKMEINNDQFPRLFTIDYDKKLAINSLPKFEIECIVPLGISLPESGDYNLAMNSLENTDANVVLEDRLTSTFTDLSKHAYDFYTTDSENLERFVLHFYKSSTEIDYVDQNEIDIYSHEDNIVIRLNTLSVSEDRYEIFDLTGNIIESGQLSKTTTRIKQTERDQMVIVKVLNNDRVTIKKVMVK